MKLYLENGFLNQSEILKAARDNRAAFIIEVGKRQIGKTFGTLELMLKEKEKFILMRRTQSEADFLTSGAINPFRPIDPAVEIKRDTKYTGAIFREGEQIGITAALSTISKIRGFYGEEFKHLVYDEFIPENHVMKMKNEGDAFLKSIVTISGNRELKGSPPLITWLLANSNNIGSPILRALNVTEKIEQMISKGKEYSLLKDRGIIIIMPKSERITEERNQGALVKAVGRSSRFYQMAYGNEFSYNDSENVITKNLKEYRALVSMQNRFSVFQHKSNGTLYVTEFMRTGNILPDSARGGKMLQRIIPDIRLLYTGGRIYFSTLALKECFIDTIF